MPYKLTRGSTLKLGYVQIVVMHLLANGEKSVSTLAYDWPGLSTNSVRSAIDSLARRGFVDAVRFEGNERLFGLTKLGREAEVILVEDD